jgi:predicted dithiol-disulfide oxidoreductase (DUF899 family)
MARRPDESGHIGRSLLSRTRNARGELGDDRPGPTSGQTALLEREDGPCPSCVALLDQLDGAADHAAQQVNLAVVPNSPPARLLTFAEERGWRRLRLVSSAGNTYNLDYHGQTADGSQRPKVNVFLRDGAVIRHFWARSSYTRRPTTHRIPATSGASSLSGTSWT